MRRCADKGAPPVTAPQEETHRGRDPAGGHQRRCGAGEVDSARASLDAALVVGAAAAGGLPGGAFRTFAQLADDPSSHPDRFPTEEAADEERKRLFKIIEDLVIWENSANERGAGTRPRRNPRELRRTLAARLRSVLGRRLDSARWKTTSKTRPGQCLDQRSKPFTNHRRWLGIHRSGFRVGVHCHTAFCSCRCGLFPARRPLSWRLSKEFASGTIAFCRM